MTNGANGAELITLINTGLTFITVVTSIVSLHLAKKQIKQEIEQNRQKAEEQQKQYLEEKRHIEEVDRLHEKPYLVFQEARISDESDEKVTRIDFIFKNKGRGAAYDIVPELECMAKKKLLRDKQRFTGVTRYKILLQWLESNLQLCGHWAMNRNWLILHLPCR